MPLPLGGLEWSTTGDFSWSDAQYTDNSNTSRVGSRSLLGLRTGLAYHSASIGLYATNLLDDRDPNVAIPWTNAANSFRRAWLVVPEPGRTIGIEARIKF